MSEITIEYKPRNIRKLTVKGNSFVEDGRVLTRRQLLGLATLTRTNGSSIFLAKLA